jgi:histidinol-phosphate aminotransferase
MSWREHLRDDLPRALAPRPRDLIALDYNEGPSTPGLEERAAFRATLASVPVNRYPDDRAAALRAALAARWGVSADELLIGNGSIEVVDILMKAVRRPGARVLLPSPTFDQFGALARIHGLEEVTVPLGANFALDEASTAAAIDGLHPALAFFPSPNNPTGNCLDPDTLERLARRMDSVFVVDEAYADFAGRTLLPRVRSGRGLFVMRSLSKVGLAGLRIGALIGPREAIAAIDRARLPFNVSAVAQALACAALSFPERMAARVAATVAARQRLDEELRAITGLEVYPSQANFLLVRTPPGVSAMTARLAAAGIAVRDVSTGRGLERCIRITVGSDDENRRCARAVRAILAAPVLVAPAGGRQGSRPCG